MSKLRDAARPALPQDAANATLVGRAWRPDAGGPSVVVLRDGVAFDISRHAPTIRDLCEQADPPEPRGVQLPLRREHAAGEHEVERGTDADATILRKQDGEQAPDMRVRPVAIQMQQCIVRRDNKVGVECNRGGRVK